jgi:hypothetical protein
MIYKIIMEFDDLQNLIEKLSKDFNVLFFDKALYICSKKFKNISLANIRKILSTDNAFLISMDETNLKNESNYVRDWCMGYFIESDIKKFEQNEQQLLKEYMKCLDDCEKQLQEIIEKGG